MFQPIMVDVTLQPLVYSASCSSLCDNLRLMSPVWRLWLLLGSALCLAHPPEKDHNRSGDEADDHQESRSPSGSSSTQTCDPDHDSSATSSNDPCACSPGGTGRTSAGSAGGTGGPAHVPGRGRASSRTPPGTLSGTLLRSPSPWGRETEATSSNHPFGSSAARSGRPAQSGRPQMGRSSRNTSPSASMWQQSCSSAACSGGQMNNIPGGVGMSGVSGPYPLFWCIQQPWQLPPDVRVRMGFQNGREGVPRVAPLDSPPPSEEQARREQWARENLASSYSTRLFDCLKQLCKKLCWSLFLLLGELARARCY